MNFTHALGWTLLHFLWEGALIALLLAAVLMVLRRARPNARYMASCMALVLMLVCAAATLAALKYETPGAAVAGPAPAPAARGEQHTDRSAAVSAARTGADYLPAIVWAWFGGVLALSIRSAGGWAVAARFARRYTWAAEPFWEGRLAVLAERLRITRPVKLAISGLAQVPAAIGWARPIVLLPATVFTGLSTEQIEALLAHELAHVRRHDYLVNLLQTGAETLLFYHPAVWWVSRNIREEREHCCDDLTVEICGDRVAYIEALTGIEETRQATPRLAMAADGGSLLKRVERLLGMNAGGASAAPGLLTGIGAAAAALAMVLAANGHAARPEKTAETHADVSIAPVLLVQNVTGEAQAAPARATAEKSDTASNGSGWLEQMQAEGYRNLTVDQMIAMKIHGVTAEYVRQLKAAGLQPSPDELVAFRIHGVTADYIDGMKQSGLKNLKADELVAFRIHGATPVWVREMQSLGLANLSADDVVALRIHSAEPGWVKEMQALGFGKLSAEQVVAMRIHGVEPAQVREIQAMGYQKLSVDDVVAMRIHGVTPAFIRDARNRGMKDLSIEQLIRLKQLGILKSPEII